MGRRPCCSKEGLSRGAWTANEDKLLVEYIKAHGEGKWRNIPKAAGLKRCGKSCRLRWLNYLRPDIKRGNLTEDEEDLIIRLHKLLGNRWSLIAGRLPGRTDNEIKNYWNTKLSKKVQTNQSKHSKTVTKSVVNQAATSSGVIRTKAVRCNRALVTPSQNQTGITHDIEVPSIDASSLKHHVAVESESNDGPFLYLSKEENSSEYMIDFDAGEINLSEILDSSFNEPSDLHDICNMGNVIEDIRHNDGSKAKLPSFSGQAFLVNTELFLENWNAGDWFQAIKEPDFGSLASFLESSDREI